MVTTLWQAIEATAQPVLISIATVAVFALFQLIAPTARWARRLKRDGEIYAALPDGPEKDLWAARVTAQGERLRIYWEDVTLRDQAIAWYAFITLVGTSVGVISDGARGWPVSQVLVAEQGYALIPLSLALAMNLAFAVYLSARLVTGQSTALRPGTGGFYPKYAALQQSIRERSAQRAKTEVRMARVQAAELQEAKRARRAGRGD